MTTELLYTALRFGSLVLIWVLIGSAVLFLRRDMAAYSGGGATAKAGRRRSRRASKTVAPSSSPNESGRVKTPRYLAFTSGPLSNKRVPLRISPIVIGRAPDCTVPIEDTYASGHHLRLYKKDDQWFVEDLNSTNGTLLNGALLHSVSPLNIGMRLQIGQTTMELTR